LRRLGADTKISIAADTCLRGSGERMDLGYAVSVIADRLLQPGRVPNSPASSTLL
jgi:hypothetical protein